jgi:hypothetical protein
MPFTPYWANVTNQVNTMWLPAMMNTSHDGLFGYGWPIGSLG